MSKTRIPRPPVAGKPVAVFSRPGLSAPRVQKKACCDTDTEPTAPDVQLQRAGKLGHRIPGIQRMDEPELQTKLTLGPAGDRYEQEADQVARDVVREISAPAPAQAEGGVAQREDEAAPSVQRMDDFDEDELQAKLMDGASGVQRMDDFDEDELQAKLDTGAEGGPVSSDIEASIQQARSGGQGLDNGVRGSMESAFGADFSGVKVHSDSASDGLNRSLRARAFTTGQDVFFRQGEYNPQSSGGQELLAHELTHVVQQNGSQVQKKERGGEPTGR